MWSQWGLPPELDAAMQRLPNDVESVWVVDPDCDPTWKTWNTTGTHGLVIGGREFSVRSASIQGDYEGAWIWSVKGDLPSWWVTSDTATGDQRILETRCIDGLIATRLDTESWGPLEDWRMTIESCFLVRATRMNVLENALSAAGCGLKARLSAWRCPLLPRADYDTLVVCGPIDSRKSLRKRPAELAAIVVGVDRDGVCRYSAVTTSAVRTYEWLVYIGMPESPHEYDARTATLVGEFAVGELGPGVFLFLASVFGFEWFI